MARIKLVYYDTCIWVAWAIESDEHHSTARKLIGELVPNKEIAIVPDLVILETTHVLRRKIMQGIQFKGDSFKDIEKAQSRVEEIISENFTSPIKLLEQKKKIQRKTPDMSIVDHHDIILKKMKNSSGKTKTVKECPDCENRLYNFKNSYCIYCNKSITAKTRYEYVGLGHEDLEHAYFAQLCNVETFYTFDKGFSFLYKDKDFKFKIKIYSKDKRPLA